MQKFFKENQFYHEETKRLLIAVSNLFTGITIRKMDAAGVTHQVYEIPIDFGPKNKWISLIRERPDLTSNQVQVTMPRISFEITGFKYAPERKIGNVNTFAGATTTTGRTKVFNPIPYDIGIALHVMTKDQVDALQVVEQITPFFQPFLNINFDILPEYNIKKDIPIVLSPEIETEDNYDGSPDQQRIVINTFNLTAKMYFFGHIENPKSVIKDVRVGVKLDSTNPNRNFRTYVNPLSAKKQDPHSVASLWS